VDQVAVEIQERLGENYLVDPHVTVSVWEYLSQWVNVIGEVAKPGRYYMTGPTTLIDAISQAGGVKPSAGDAISVTRRPQESDPAAAGEVMRFSSSGLLSEKSSAAEFSIRPGDVIQVLPDELIYVSGAVRSPGPYPLGRGTTLTRAIDLAGGMTSDAHSSEVDLVRMDEGEKRRLSFDIREIESRRVEDPVLRPGDEVVVRRRT
jgi:polysaccharide export outer membrane protein